MGLQSSPCRDLAERAAVRAQDRGEGARTRPLRLLQPQPTQLAWPPRPPRGTARAARRQGPRAPDPCGQPTAPAHAAAAPVEETGRGARWRRRAGRKLRKSPRVRSLSGAAAGPLASCPAQAGQGMGAVGAQGLITWRGALPTSPQATIVTMGLRREAPQDSNRTSLSQAAPPTPRDASRGPRDLRPTPGHPTSPTPHTTLPPPPTLTPQNKDCAPSGCPHAAGSGEGNWGRYEGCLFPRSQSWVFS